MKRTRITWITNQDTDCISSLQNQLFWPETRMLTVKLFEQPFESFIFCVSGSSNRITNFFNFTNIFTFYIKEF